MARIGDMELDEDISFQEREWTAERIGWVALFVLLALAVLGLFGNGPISWTSTTSEDGALEVSYERFGRRGGTQTLTIAAEASAASNGAWEIDLSREYLAAVRVDAMTPQPDSVAAVPAGLRYTFLQATAGADLDVELSITPTALWGASGPLALAEGERVTVRQFFFP